MENELQADETKENEMSQETKQTVTEDSAVAEEAEQPAIENSTVVEQTVTENTTVVEEAEQPAIENGTIVEEADPSDCFDPENNQASFPSQESDELEISEVGQTHSPLRAPAYVVSPETKIGNDWTLGDFIYVRNKVIGFSESGLIKVQTQKELILPHLNPETGETVDTVGENEDANSWFHQKGLVSIRDYNGNIKVIEGHGSNRVIGDRSSGVFLNNNISQVDLPNVESIGSYAFRNNAITKLNFPKLTYIGSHSLDGAECCFY